VHFLNLDAVSILTLRSKRYTHFTISEQDKLAYLH